MSSLAVAPLTPCIAPAAASRSVRSIDLRCDVLAECDRSAALSVWRDLESRLHGTSQPVGLMSSSGWVSNWLAHYGDVVPHEFLIARQDHLPVGAALLTRGVERREGPFRIRTRHLGTAGERSGESVCVEYNQLLVDSAARPAFEEAVIAHVLKDKSWEAFCLDGFQSSDAQRLLQDIPGAQQWARESPYFDLQKVRAAEGDPIDALGRSTRQNVRRLLRKYGQLDTEWATTPDQANDIFAELIELHQARWQAVGKPGAFHSSRFADFQRSLVREAFAGPQSPLSGRVVLFRVRRQGSTVGCLLLLVDRNRMLDYLSGFADFNVHASPGIVTHLLCLQEALRRGYDAYDFLVGEKRHKQNLSTDVQHLVWATWTRRTLKSRTIATLRNLKRRWTDFRARRVAPASPAGGEMTDSTREEAAP